MAVFFGGPSVDRHRVCIYLSLGSSPANFQDSVVNLLSSFGAVNAFGTILSTQAPSFVG